MTQEHLAQAKYNEQVRPFHGAVLSPKTMSLVCEDLGLISRWQNNELEGGKNYPGTTASSPDTFPKDVASSPIPAEGTLLSGGRIDDSRKTINYTNDEIKAAIGKDFDWRNTDCVYKVKGGDKFIVNWEYVHGADHPARGFDWFITKQPWDFSKRVTSDAFETKDGISQPFSTDYISESVDFWNLPKPSTTQTVDLPHKEPGYYILLQRWVVGNTGNAFHQSWILKYEDAELAGHGVVLGEVPAEV